MGPPVGYPPHDSGAPPPAGYPYPPQPQHGAAPGPYPPQQQQHGPPGGHFAHAPAGYPAMPAGAPPGHDNSSPLKSHENPQQQGPAGGGYIAPGSGPSPGAAYHQQGHHPGAQFAPAPGIPMQGGGHGGMGVASGPGHQQQEKCGCSVGWVLFGLGFLFTPCWLGAMLVPLCTRKRNDRLAGMASAVALLIAVVVAVALAVTQTRNRRYYSTGYNHAVYTGSVLDFTSNVTTGTFEVTGIATTQPAGPTDTLNVLENQVLEFGPERDDALTVTGNTQINPVSLTMTDSDMAVTGGTGQFMGAFGSFAARETTLSSNSMSVVDITIFVPSTKL
ncbi:hypothetical protein COO60DRAFT_1643465 [Scenedesmus sp. NREL 46B-D3]|nr:hypothetical protein COO60DRAFT_1643465 [Scenedesmus sp. NREL 46B-D3]